MDLASEIAEYARNVCRANSKRTIKRSELINEIMQDAQATKQWPVAKVEQWTAAIEVAIERGLLRRDSETIWIPEVVKEAKLVQRELF